ncbi:MAG: phosphate ABC transporter permease PstA [Solirubrobacterales bacterium]|nr:phosphate ABC transporter permease PstA [Solirubrobacterales bacterium]
MTAASETLLGTARPFDPTAPLSASGNLRRRAVVDRVVQFVSSTAAVCAVAVLVIVVYGVLVRGAAALNLGFVFENPTGLDTGGIANALLGTLEIVAIGAVIALPLGVLTGLYLTEFAGARSQTGRVLTLALDMMQGLPTIVVGLFVYGLLVIPMKRETGVAGAIALAIVMLPLMARASQEVLLLVPGTLREAADALGVARWRAVLTVILPSAMGGIVTGAILAIARAAGETAPLLICDSIYNYNATSLNPFRGVPNVPMLIYTSYDLPLPQAVVRAWGAALVLMIFILLANIGARVLLARSRAKMGP